MLSPEQLDVMRFALNQSLPEVCAVYRPTEVETPQGEVTRDYPSTPTITASCRIAPRRLTPRDMAVGGQTRAVGDWVLTFPALTDLRTEDRIIVNARTFEVVNDRARSYELSRRVECIEVE